VDLAKTAPRRTRTTSVDPNTLPPQAKINQMPKEQASKLFAGVGEWYIDREDNDHAEDFFRTAYTLDSGNNVAKNGLSEALSLQGNGLLVKDDPERAKKRYDEAVSLNPNNAVAYFGLGQIADMADDDKTATTNFEKAVDLAPALTDIYVPLGILYFQNHEIEKADKLLTKALTHAPDDPETEFFYGLVRYTQGNKDAEALAAFRKAKAAKPDYAGGMDYAGLTLLRIWKTDESPNFTKATI
jgi:superkiller protein 3